MSRRSLGLLLVAIGFLPPPAVFGAEPLAPAPGKTGELYVIATSHLDTQWRWTIRDTIDRYVPATLRDNFALFEKFPAYTFSFEGAFRYMLMKEYYPAEYEQLKTYIAAGRWHVAGSWVDAVDTNMPAPESLVRQALYGNGFFRREFGVTSRDVFLPDCFGFGYALPSVMAHTGLLGFSTQKLSWGSAYGVPFDIGMWQGVGGQEVIAAINPGDYVSKITGDLSSDPSAEAAVRRLADAAGLPFAVKYFGTGDTGGSPKPLSVDWLQKSLAGPGPIEVRSVASDQLARDLRAHASAEQLARLPRYRGEFLMTSHGAGCYTSQAAMKRWNRRNERLADAAERAAVAAAWLGGSPYPKDTLREAWIRVLWHQFHDDLTGTSIPEAYEFSWNDEAIAQKQFEGVLRASAGTVAAAMDTRAAGIPVLVYNPISLAREDIVETDLEFAGAAPPFIRVIDHDGHEWPGQVLHRDGRRARVLFVARMRPLSFAVVGVQGTEDAPQTTGGATATGRVLENARYRVEIDDAGDIASVLDKINARQLLSAPAHLDFLADRPPKWPAWEVSYEDVMAPPRRPTAGAPRIRVAEDGPARATIEIVRQIDGSTITQRVSLCSAQLGHPVDVVTEIDWRTPGTLLKAAFPLTVENEKATYDLGLGVIERGLNTPKLYEVPAQQWADVTAADGSYGVTVLSDSKYGWDRPDAKTLRLTLIHTPGIASPRWNWVGDQASQDIGRHRFAYGLVGHTGGWTDEGAAWYGERFNNPLFAWPVTAHEGTLGREFLVGLLTMTTHRTVPSRETGIGVAIRALKQAEESEEVVVRLVELYGREARARLALPAPITKVREVNGAEEPLEPAPGEATIEDGRLVASFRPYQLRTFALRMGPPPAAVPPPQAVPLALPYDLDGISRRGEARGGDFDGQQHAIAAELLPARIVVNGVAFQPGPTTPKKTNLLTCRGQKLDLPAGPFTEVDLLAASRAGDRAATFKAGDRAATVTIADWAEPIGQWDDRLVAGRRHDDPAQIAPGYTKDIAVGWIGTHRHDARGDDESYTFTQFTLARVPVPDGARTLSLPDDPSIVLLAATAARDDRERLEGDTPYDETPVATTVHFRAPQSVFLDRLRVELLSPTPGAVVRYTLDGSTPGPEAPVYSGPLTLEATTTVKARASARGLDERFVAEATFTKLRLLPARQVLRAEPGLACSYYEGEFKALPDFASLRPTRTVVVDEFGIPPVARPEDFALRIEGFLRAPADGIYTFTLDADDGASLAIDDQQLIAEGAENSKAEIALAAGLHRIVVEQYQKKGDSALELRLAAPGERAGPIPKEMLVH